MRAYSKKYGLLSYGKGILSLIITMLIVLTITPTANAAETYTLSFETNGGAEIDSVNAEGGTVIDLNEYTTTRKGYFFTGWLLDENESNITLMQTVTLNTDTTIYAQWDLRIPITVDHSSYIDGYSDGTVRPEAYLSRGETAVILFRLISDESRTYYWTRTNDYSDVEFTVWYNNAVSTMTNADIIYGYEDGTFRGDNTITRAEFAVLLARVDGGTYIGSDLFSDISGSWASNYINLVTSRGWIEGYADGSFRPEQPITRAEAITMINKMCGRDKIAEMHEDMKTWSDNVDGKWYYEAIQEATNSHEYYIDENGDEHWTSIIPEWTTWDEPFEPINN